MSSEKVDLKTLAEALGRPYSEELGIDLRTCKSGEICKWFLASILFAARISEEIAKKTYRVFEANGIITPEKILSTGWHGLVDLLDRGGYARYDFKTADKLLDVFGFILTQYGGDLNRLHDEASDPEDLVRRLESQKGIGDVTVSIFLRDMRHCWSKARPEPTAIVREAMGYFHIDNIDAVAEKEGIDAVRLETALFRFGKGIRKKSRHRV